MQKIFSLGTKASSKSLTRFYSNFHPFQSENGVVSKVNIEPDGTGLTCSLAEKIME